MNLISLFYHTPLIFLNYKLYGLRIFNSYFEFYLFLFFACIHYALYKFFMYFNSYRMYFHYIQHFCYSHYQSVIDFTQLKLYQIGSFYSHFFIEDFYLRKYIDIFLSNTINYLMLIYTLYAKKPLLTIRSGFHKIHIHTKLCVNL